MKSNGPFAIPTIALMESVSDYGDVYVSGTNDIVLAAAACRRYAFAQRNL